MELSTARRAVSAGATRLHAFDKDVFFFHHDSLNTPVNRSELQRLISKEPTQESDYLKHLSVRKRMWKNSMLEYTILNITYSIYAPFFHLVSCLPLY